MKTRERILVITVLLLTVTGLSGCATGTGIFGKRGKDTSVLVPGTPRETVIAKLGTPDTISTNEDGTFQDTWVIDKSDTREGRGMFRTSLDILSLGLWEVVGEPIVSRVIGGKKTTTYIITYDEDNKIKHMKAIKE